MTEIDFDKAFSELTGNAPFPWQRALYEQFISGRDDNIPKSCNLPTGLGKTSVIAVWLLALANGARVPRRLVYVVNRRTVVDQTTDEVVRYRRKLAGEEAATAAVSDAAERLQKLAALPGAPLAISTLRGQYADNREWSSDPARAAVICGTVDMIGSRLLFSGYGCGFKTRPLHAGFLGQDSLIVHDEAHLEPAFQELLLAIEKEQREGRTRDFRPLKVMEMTATSRAGTEKPFELTDDDKNNQIVQNRIRATKALRLHESTDDKKLAEEITGLAKGYKNTGRAVAVFVRKVDDVAKIVGHLVKEKLQAQQLTGTLRGLERDDLPRDPIFARFLPPSNRPNGAKLAEGTVYLVCTSAGEVGVNISADHLICDLSTFESMAQRFGRVNRFGEHSDTEVHVIYPKEFQPEDYEQRRKRTLGLLELLRGDASPAAIGELRQRAIAEGTSLQPATSDAVQALRDYVIASQTHDPRLGGFAAPPDRLPTSDILFDAWSLTTVRDKLPGRQPVVEYLHGVEDEKKRETQVAWREEVGIIAGDLLKRHRPQDLLEAYPLKPQELLRDSSSRVFDQLKKLGADAKTPLWVVDDDDTVRVTTLGELVETGREAIEYRTVLLPPIAGGLANGMLTASSPVASDVADEWCADGTRQQRCRIRGDGEVSDEMRLILTIDTEPDTDDGDEAANSRRFWRWYEVRDGGDDEGVKNSKLPVLWQVHTDDVVRNTNAIVAKLDLGELAKAFEIAARCHDLGKNRKLFQAVLGNRDYPQVMLAKSGKKGERIEETYRHEFGSLIDAGVDNEFVKLNDELKEFVQHVIATHHGRGRPHFPADESFDPERSRETANNVAREVPHRFATLQRKYGRWGLAYLESLLRAADYAASAKPSAFVMGDR